MSAYDDVLVGRSGEVSHDVENVPRQVLNVTIELDVKALWQRKRLRPQCMIDLFLYRLEIAARGREPLLDVLARNLDERYAGIRGTGKADELFQRVGSVIRCV